MSGIRLWLDDLRFAPDGWVHVKTVTEAIAILQEGEVVEMSFDNDLGVPIDENGEGYQVANWIEEQAFFGHIPSLRWKIHSANPVARRRIRQAMGNADRYWQARPRV